VKDKRLSKAKSMFKSKEQRNKAMMESVNSKQESLKQFSGVGSG
jgi:hypothetical protein